MRNLLTIGEVAYLLNLSTSQIRFYEKKNLISPARIDNNGYRLYSYKELDNIEVIVFFRSLGLSIKEISNLINEKDDYDFLGLLDKAYLDLRVQINDLNKKLIYIKKLKKRYEKFEENNKKLIYYDKRNLYIIDKNIDINIEKNEKYTYDFYKEYNIRYNSESLFFYIINNSLNMICLQYCGKNRKISKLPCYVLEEGYYFNFNVHIKNYSEIKFFYKTLLKECEKLGYEPVGEYIAIENSVTYPFSKSKIYLTLQIKVKEKN